MKSIFTSTRGQHLRELRLEISNKLSINYLKLLEIIIKKKARKKERKRRYVYAYKPLRFSNNLKSRMCVYKSLERIFWIIFQSRNIRGEKYSGEKIAI